VDCLTALSITVTLATSFLLAQPDEPKAPVSHDASAKAPIAELRFLTGVWRADDAEGFHEEQWSPPHASGMIGTFRWIDGGGHLRLSELLTITPREDGVYLNIRHFNGPDLTPWDSEAAGPTVARLQSAADNRAVFKGIPPTRLDTATYALDGQDSLTITLAFADGRDPITFTLKQFEAGD